MNISGIGHSHGLEQIQQSSGRPDRGQQTSPTAPPSGDATTVDISAEARELSHGRKANPRQIADDFGYSNFGQVVKTLKQGGSDVGINQLVQGNESAVASAQEALAPPPEAEAAVSDIAPTETPAENNPEPLVIQPQDSGLDEILQQSAPPEPPPAENEDLSLLEQLLEESTA